MTPKPLPPEWQARINRMAQAVARSEREKDKRQAAALAEARLFIDEILYPFSHRISREEQIRRGIK